MSRILLRLIFIACFAKSEPIHRLPSFSATANVVPEPQKKSATMSVSLEDARIILFNNLSGF